MDKVTKYKVYCETDAKWEYFYLEDDAVPTETCPVNGAHTVTTGSLSEEAVVEKSQTKIEEQVPQGGKKVTNRGFQFDAAANSETTHEFQFTENLYCKDGELEVKDGDFKDYAYMALVDVENLLGYGAGFVLHEYIKDYPVDSSNGSISLTKIENKAITELNLNGFYMRVKYYNHTLSAVRCKVRVNGYS